MSLAKSAQLVIHQPEDDLVVYEEKPSKEEVLDNHLELSLDGEDVDASDSDMAVHLPPLEVTFHLPKIPGSELSEQELEVMENSDKEEKSEEPQILTMKDKWNWKQHGHAGFLTWLNEMLKNIPKHSGKDSSGIERAISYMKKLDNEISRAMQGDLEGVIDSGIVEKARDQIDDGIARLEEHLDKITNTRFKTRGKGKKKTAEVEEDTLTKEAQKAAHVGGMIIAVPLLISSIARACINATVSNGRDMELMVKRAIKLYDLTKREQAELFQLLADMNFPMKRDRLHDFEKEEFDPKSSNNAEFGAQYQS